MAARTSGILGTVRRLGALVGGSAMLLTLAGLPPAETASAAAGNPILGTIHGRLQPNADGTVTVFVRGEWNWLSHNSDCNFDRAATGVGMIWNDPTEPGFTVTKGTIAAGVGVMALRGTTAGAHDAAAGRGRGPRDAARAPRARARRRPARTAPRRL